HDCLRRGELLRGQGDFVVAYLAGAACREAAGEQVGSGNEEETDTDELQCGGSQVPFIRQIEQARRKNNAEQDNVAEPVGDDVDGKNFGDGTDFQSQT